MRTLIHPVLCVLSMAVIMMNGACSSPNETSGTDGLRLIGTIEIQESDSVFIGDFETAYIDSNPTRIYIPDIMMHRIAVVDEEGEIVRTIGERGQGPGEIERPLKAVPLDDRIHVQTANRFVVFDSSGVFLHNAFLPDGYHQSDRWSLTPHKDHLYFVGTNVYRPARGLLASPEDRNILQLNDDLEVVNHFGSYPPLYQEEEHIWRFGFLDLIPTGRLAISYTLLPLVDIYDLNQPDLPLVARVTLDHPSFIMIGEPMSMATTLEDVRRIGSSVSGTRGAWLTNDTTVVLQFVNRSEAFYNSPSDDLAAYYAAVGTTTGRTVGRVELPGPILGKDPEGHLYIRHSNVPDERVIGIYEVVAGE